VAVLLVAPHQGTQPSKQLLEGERLGQVIVGARVQAGDPVVDLVAGGKHDHRRLDPVLPEPAANLHPILLRDHEVEDDRVVSRCLGQLLGALPVRGDVDGVALVLQELLEQRRQFPLVLDKQEIHRNVLPKCSVGTNCA
jgi:hypothetical protein